MQNSQVKKLVLKAFRNYLLKYKKIYLQYKYITIFDIKYIRQSLRYDANLNFSFLFFTILLEISTFKRVKYYKHKCQLT